MLSLEQDLQLQRSTIDQFIQLSARILQYLPNVISGSSVSNGYIIKYSQSAGTTKYVRPISQFLFIANLDDFEQKTTEFKLILEKIKVKETEFTQLELETIDSVLYTIQQSIGAGFDLLVEQNSARKHVGNRFEELIKAVFTEIGIPNKRVVIKIPYDSDEGIKQYTCENDLILSPYSDIDSSETGSKDIVLNTTHEPRSEDISDIELTTNSEKVAEKYINEQEVIVSVKTTSKDRMGKMFMDKILLQNFVKHDLKVIGIFLNDVQRKKTDGISYTLVSGLFMVYNKFITELEGVYYLDPPPNALKPPYNKHIKRFSHLITKDIQELLSS